jgi:hypothetical protein
MNRKNSPPPPFLRAALLLLLLSFSALVPRCEAAAVAAFAGAAPADEEDAQPSSLPFLRGGGGGGGGGSGGGDGGALGGWLEGPLRGIQKRYDGLSPRGRFIATAAAGFVASRLVMDVGATSLKVAGAAFIVCVSERRGACVYTEALLRVSSRLVSSASVFSPPLFPSLPARRRRPPARYRLFSFLQNGGPAPRRPAG